MACADISSGNVRYNGSAIDTVEAALGATLSVANGHGMRNNGDLAFLTAARQTAKQAFDLPT